MKLKKIKIPNTFLIIFSLIILTAVLTYVIPAGEFNRVILNGKEVVDGESFHLVESNPQGIEGILTAPIKGFVDAALIIGFVLIVGGAFSVFQKTEAIDSAIKSIAKAHKKSKFVRTMIIPIFMVLFSLGGAVFGMSEEVIPFILVFVPMALILGYDTITGVAIPFVGAGVGFAGAFLNPFTVGIAQGIAGIPLFSGIEYRVLVWLLVTSLAIFFVMRYANKIKNNPSQSSTYEHDLQKRKDLHIDTIENFDGIDRKHKLVLSVFAIGMLVLVFGVLEYGWYIEEISALFFLLGIIVGVVGKLNANEITKAFINGAKDLVGTALMIGLARGVLVVASDGKIVDTILAYLSTPLNGLHPVVSSQAMFGVQILINFFVPSGSGQAALTMPVMAPLSDLVGVSRQIAVLAYQFGDGFSNLIFPTAPVTIGVLSLAEIPWEKWAKWILPLEIILGILCLLLLIPPFLIGW